METTKRRHFGFLERLDAKKKKFNLDPTDTESRLLEVLLSDHNEEVQAFKQTCQELKQRNEAAHAALFEYIAGLNHALDAGTHNTSH